MNNVFTSANPGFTCPSLYNNETLLRFIDPYKLCVVKGSMSLACVCLRNFYMPIDVWNESIVSLSPGEVRRLELGMIAEYGKRREIYGYELLMYLPGSPQANIFASLNISCVEKTLNETITFYTGTSFKETISNLKSAINHNSKLKNEVEIIDTDEHLKSFQIRAIDPGFEFGYNLILNTEPETNVPSTYIQSAIRYPHGRCKFIYVGPMFMENVVPPLPSDNKHIQYAYDDDYQENGSNATFRNMGKMFIHSSDDDVEETDMNLIETIWIKNTHSKQLQIQILVAR